MCAKVLPNGVDILDVVRVLACRQRAIPDAGAPVAPAADFALVLGVGQDLGTLLLHLVLADVLRVVREAGGAVVVGRGRELAVGDLAEGLLQRGHHQVQVRDVRLVELRAVAEIDVALVVEQAARVEDVELSRLGGLDPRQVLIAAGERAVDDLDPGLLLVGIEGMLAERLGDDATPAVEADRIRLGGHRLAGQRAHGCAGHAGGDASGAEEREEGAPVEIAVAIALEKALVTFGVIHGGLSLLAQIDCGRAPRRPVYPAGGRASPTAIGSGCMQRHPQSPTCRRSDGIAAGRWPPLSGAAPR